MISHRPIRLLAAAALTAFCVAAGSAHAQTPFTLSLTALVNGATVTTKTFTPVFAPASPTYATAPSAFTESGGLTSGTGAASNANWAGWDVQTRFFYYSVTAAAGFDLTITEVNSNLRSSNTGPRAVAVETATNLAGPWTQRTVSNLTTANDTAVNATGLSITVPAGATLYIRYRNTSSTASNGGTVGSGGTHRINSGSVVGTYAPASGPGLPVINSFSPSSGPAGTPVSIVGSNFTGATAVTFNGVSAVFSNVTATNLDATVPSGALSGAIGVTTSGGTGFSTNSFLIPTVTVTLPSTILEGTTATGEVTIPEALLTNLPVTLTSSSTNDLTVETPIEIFAGTTNYTFNISAPVNSSSSTNTVVTVTPAAAGFASAPGTTTVINTDAVKIPLSSLTTNSYTQDFNTLGTNTWTNAISPAVGVQASLGGAVNTNLNGWFASFLGGTPNTNLVADDGNGTNAAVYNYGNTGGANRSLGGLANNGTAPAYGALVSNSTASTLNSVVINLTGKFWRSSSSVQNFLSFAYGEVDGTIVNNINFLTSTNTNNVFRLPAANIYGPSPVPTNAVGPIDGNNSTNQVQISNVAIPVDLAPGETMFIRWQDFDNSGFDAGLAIDDVSLTASTALAGPVLDIAVLDNLTLLQDAATVSSSVLTDAGSALTSRGFVFSQTSVNSNPVVGGPNTTAITNLPPDVSAFTNTLSGLMASTSYTVKSFAVSAAGTNYSPAIVFNTLAPSPPFNGVYTQSFDGLTNTFFPNGWRCLSTSNANSYAGDWNSTNAVSAGFYGRTNIPGILGYLHTSTTGVLSNKLTLVNNTGGTLTNLWVSYTGEVNVLNPTSNTRFPEWTVVVDGQTNASLLYSTAGGVSSNLVAQVTGLNITNGGNIVISWSSDRGAGAGSSRMIGMTDVRVATNAPSATPTINVSGSFTNFVTTVGTNSPSQSLTVSGSNLTNNITVSTPAYYQISTNNTNFSFVPVDLVPSGGTVTNTTLYFRLFATNAVGNANGSILFDSPSAFANFPVTGFINSSFSYWLSGGASNNANLLKYAIGGASSPTATNGVASQTAVTSSNLSITAIVRTNDPSLDVFGEGITNLSLGSWSTNGVTITPGDQSGVPAGTERQIFSIPRTNNSQFLRLDAILQP
jgi:hypothetical protein